MHVNHSVRYCMRTPLNALLRDYVRIRTAERHGFTSADGLLRLPDVSRSHPHADIWRIRRLSYNVLLRSVLPQGQAVLRVLDLGAGVGWLSYRLAQIGHAPIAVDINNDERDGLGAARHYKCHRVIAEFDRLPFCDSSADLAIFNGSFHYSTDYSMTLREAFRVARSVVVMDSPIYHDITSGQRMVQERQAEFEKKFGIASHSFPCRQFLTWAEIDLLSAELAEL